MLRLKALVWAALVTLMLGSVLRAQTLNDFFAGRAGFREEQREFGANFHFSYISTWKVSSEIWAYYIVNNASGPAGVGLAKSFDGGESFTDFGTVIPAGNHSWDNRMRSFPGVWRDGNKWYLVFEAAGDASPGDVGLAESDDGIHWRVDAEPILKHQSGGWERQNIGTPSLYKEGNTWYLFYHGYGRRSGSRDDVQIGVAYGTDLRHLQRYQANPIIPTSDSGFDSGTVGKRSIIREGSWYFMVYEVSTESVGNGDFSGSQWSSGMARAKSLLGPWEKYPLPVLPIIQGFGHDGPEWLRTPDGKLHIYYRFGPNLTKRSTLYPDAVGWKFEAEQLSHQIGRTEADGWAASTSDYSAAYLCYGPYTSVIQVGPRAAAFRLLVDNNTANNDQVVKLDVYDASAGRVLASRVIRRRDFTNTNRYQYFSLFFTSPGPDLLEFRTYWYDTAYVKQDHVLVR